MKICFKTIAVGIAFAVAVFFAADARYVFAVDQLGLFELDGNATDNSGAPLPDDWQTLYAGGAETGGSSSVYTGVTPDPAPQSIFTGGRKDIQDIPEWGWKNGAVPDKSDITDAQAAAYDYFGDLIVYFEADRVANAGDTFLGFWFFKDEVSLLPDGSFDGLHQPGDTLVLVNFPQAANAVPLVQVVKWDPTCSKADSNNPAAGDCAAQNLRLLAGASGAGAVCSNAVDPQPACAITNDEGGANDPTPSYWPYTSKDGFINEFPFETFFEGGINLTQLLGGEDACFASFMAESRSSSSFTASLKDFVLDSFPVCAISVTKSCTSPRLNATQDMIIYDISGTVTNDGFGKVYDVSVSDAPSFDTGSLMFDGDPSSLAGGASIGYSATITVDLDQNGLTDQVTATANTSPGGTGTTLTATDTAVCPQLQISPALSLSKNCSSAVDVFTNGGTHVVAEVNVNGEVCNVGDTKLTNVSVTDNKAGTLLSGVTLVAPDDPNNPGETPGACATYTGSYFPTEALDNEGAATNDPCLVVFKDTAEAAGKDIFGGDVTPQPAMATCPLCACQ